MMQIAERDLGPQPLACIYNVLLIHLCVNKYMWYKLVMKALFSLSIGYIGVDCKHLYGVFRTHTLIVLK